MSIAAKIFLPMEFREYRQSALVDKTIRHWLDHVQISLPFLDGRYNLSSWSLRTMSAIWQTRRTQIVYKARSARNRIIAISDSA